MKQRRVGRPIGSFVYPVRLRISVSDPTWLGICRYMEAHGITNVSEACRDALESWFDQLSEV